MPQSTSDSDDAAQTYPDLVDQDHDEDDDGDD